MFTLGLALKSKQMATIYTIPLAFLVLFTVQNGFSQQDMNNDTKDPTQQTYSIEKLAMKIKSKHVSKLKVELIRNAFSKSNKKPN